LKPYDPRILEWKTHLVKIGMDEREAEKHVVTAQRFYNMGFTDAVKARAAIIKEEEAPADEEWG
jgi:hypothetical protein